jgi:hypothetical protein
VLFLSRSRLRCVFFSIGCSIRRHQEDKNIVLHQFPHRSHFPACFSSTGELSVSTKGNTTKKIDGSKKAPSEMMLFRLMRDATQTNAKMTIWAIQDVRWPHAETAFLWKKEQHVDIIDHKCHNIIGGGGRAHIRLFDLLFRTKSTNHSSKPFRIMVSSFTTVVVDGFATQVAQV